MEHSSLSDIVIGAYEEIKDYILKNIERDLWRDSPAFRMRSIFAGC